MLSEIAPYALGTPTSGQDCYDAPQWSANQRQGRHSHGLCRDWPYRYKAAQIQLIRGHHEHCLKDGVHVHAGMYPGQQRHP